MKQIICIVVALTSSLAFAKTPTAAIPSSGSKTLNDSWYTMQAGSSPWGYFHEVIQFNHGKYFYRYDMTKRENTALYNENIGAVSEKDLTPVAFNLNKSGEGVNQSYNGAYAKGSNAGIFTVTYKGSVEKTYKRHVSKDTILEVFFPVWLQSRWKDLKPGYRSTVSIFTEDPDSSDYKSKTARVQVIKNRDVGATSCKEIKVELDNKPSVWCVTESGALVDMIVGNNEVMVKKVNGENAAKAFLGIK